MSVPQDGTGALTPNSPLPNTPAVNTRSLVGRLVRAALLWALPVLALAAFALTWLYRGSTYQIFEDPLVETVTSLINSAETIPQPGGNTIITLSQEPVDPRFQRALSGRYWEIMGQGAAGDASLQISSRSLYGSTITLSERETQYLLEAPGVEIRTSAKGPDAETLRVVARSVILPNMDSPVIMAAGVDQAPAVRAVQRFAITAILVLAALTLGLIGAVLLQVRMGLRPLFDLRDRVADVREGRATQVEGEYPREIDPLADELNSLIAHNKDVVDRARTHVSNLAHALKTPLAVLKNEAANGDTPLANITRRQTEAMTKQVNHHLSRARAASRAQTIGARTDIASTITDLSRTMEKIYRHKDLDISEHIIGGLLFRGEKTDLNDMVGNLLDNACKWAKGRILVTVTAVSDNRQVLIKVSDDGPGVEADKYAEAMKRGIRLDEDTPGTGFGLSIVDDLARAYKGSLALSRSSDLGGLCVELTLPAALHE